MILFESIAITLVLLGLGYLLVLKEYTLMPFLAPIVFIIFMASASFASLPYLLGVDEIALLNVSNALTANFITTNYLNTNTIFAVNYLNLPPANLPNPLVINALTANSISSNTITPTYLLYSKNYLYKMALTTNTLYQNTNSSLLIIYATDSNSGMKAFVGNVATNIKLVGSSDFVVSGAVTSFNSVETLYIPYSWYYQINFTSANFIAEQIGG